MPFRHSRIIGHRRSLIIATQTYQETLRDGGGGKRGLANQPGYSPWIPGWDHGIMGARLLSWAWILGLDPWILGWRLPLQSGTMM